MFHSHSVLRAAIHAVALMCLASAVCWHTVAWADLNHADRGARLVSEPTPRQRLQRQWSEFLDALAAYTAARRDEALQQARRALEALDRRIDRLRADLQRRWPELSEQARANGRAALEELERQQAALERWLADMKQASTAQWSEALRNLSRALEQAQRQLEREPPAKEVPHGHDPSPLTPIRPGSPPSGLTAI